MIIERFHKRAQMALESASRVAIKQHHKRVCVWHLMGALINDNESTVRRALKHVSTDMDSLSIRIDARLLQEELAPKTQQQPLIGRRVERAFLVAGEVADRNEDSVIKPRHLLIGLIEDPEIRETLIELGGKLERLQDDLETSAWGDVGHLGGGDAAAEALTQYTSDLTALARAGELDPVIGRESEIRLTIEVLCRRRKNNPVVIGEPGVGKTAIVEGLAQAIAAGDVPADLSACSVLALDLGQLVAGARYRGEFEERFKQVIDEVSQSGHVILFIDEIHMLMGAGGAEGAMDAANLLKPALARGEVRCLGATTLEEYRKHFEKDAALVRRFQMVQVEQPSEAMTLHILRGLKDKYEQHHNVYITDGALRQAVHLSSRYMSSRSRPDSAIDLIDQAAATVRLRSASKPADLAEIDERILALSIDAQALRREDDPEIRRQVEQIDTELAALTETSEEKTKLWSVRKHSQKEAESVRASLEQAKHDMTVAVDAEDFAVVAEFQYKTIPELEDRLHNVLSAIDGGDSESADARVSEHDVAQTVSRLTGIPVNRMASTERDRLINLEAVLSERVVGQSAVLNVVARAVRRGRAGVQSPTRPIASFLMLGPSGVGKTELAKTLASFLFDDERALIRFDMSEFMEKHTVARLLGAPPGYVGYDEGGLLTNRVKRKPFSVVLFDEVEKAHPDVFNLFLQLLDDGRLTDSGGATVDFCNTIIMMTSNLGAQHIRACQNPEDEQRMSDAIMNEVRNFFRPEFLNRIDDITVFRQLAPTDMSHIVDIQLQRLARVLEGKSIRLNISEAARTLLADVGYSPEYGARPLARTIQGLLQDPLAEGLISGEIEAGSEVWVERVGERLVLKPSGAVCEETTDATHASNTEHQERSQAHQTVRAKAQRFPDNKSNGGS